jgi:hypothetical protein
VTAGPVRRSEVELARRLCAAYISFRMGRRGVDAILCQVPKKIGSFWIELARLMSSRTNRARPMKPR